MIIKMDFKRNDKDDEYDDDDNDYLFTEPMIYMLLKKTNSILQTGYTQVRII